MIIFKKAEDLKTYLDAERTEDRILGFVPTMGALHQGHTSLVRQSAAENALTLVSIFVNPTQFNDPLDFARYPKTLDRDLALLEEAGADIVFVPDEEEIYPPDEEEVPVFDPGPLGQILEGKARPGHFRGVSQVMRRFLLLLRPERLYMGQKDFQQCMIVDQLIRHLELRTRLLIIPTVREEDGLAMSSRNRLLTEPQRILSASLYQCLISIESKKGKTPFAVVKKECEDLLRDKGLEPDYVEIAEAHNLRLLDDYSRTEPMVALVAARLGGVRLIDNLLI